MDNENKTPLNRRELIKLLLASGATVVVAFLPTKWIKPALQVGVLPAHAQTSGGSSTGATGTTGATGVTGPIGATGATGATGP